MRLCLSPLILAVVLTGCASRGSEWPSLAPRAGEVSPMVPRNVPGLQPCANATGDARCDAAPASAAAPLMPPPAPPPALADVLATLDRLERVLTAVEQAAGPARAALQRAQAAAAGSSPDSAAANGVVMAQAALDSALQPLQAAAFQVAALDEATAASPDRASYAGRIAALASRVALLDDQ